jgi:mxaJ protein
MKRRAIALVLLLTACDAGKQDALTVCADPNNLPFSNRAGEGFENRIAQLIAEGMHRKLRYVWWAQRRGYIRNTIGDGKCDLWPGVAAGVEMLATTRPYYRSSYMIVTRHDRPLGGLTLDDARLRKLRIGVQMVGDDGMNTPPAHALARRGIIGNVRGYLLYGDYRRPNPPASVVQAVAKDEIDAALVWGPLAGWAAKRMAVPMRLEPVTPWLDDAQWPMVYDISLGVPKDRPDLKAAVEQQIETKSEAIALILREYNVPIFQEQ